MAMIRGRNDETKTVVTSQMFSQTISKDRKSRNLEAAMNLVGPLRKKKMERNEILSHLVFTSNSKNRTG